MFCCRHGPLVAWATPRPASPAVIRRATSPMRMSPALITGFAASGPPEGFTDVEGSTRRWLDGPEAMQVLMGEHDAVLRDVVAKHGGDLFKHTGDGIAAAFGSAVDAVANRKSTRLNSSH